ncbi:MAG: hypothetical protein HY270_10570 [Deltaproteobacteria bacterium]|nr:hypothetical protein [Deltaproteobacteria bacterium]
MRAKTPGTVGWRLVGYCALLLGGMTAALLAWYGTGAAGVRAVIRASAKTSLILFLCAFVASSAARRWPAPATRWLLANRRYLGVSFALSHALHLAVILILLRVDPEFAISRGTIVGGGLAYLFIFAMAATSFDRSAAWVGSVVWRRLHTVGSYYIWFIFFASYAPRAAIQSIWYLPLVLLLLAGLFLRLTRKRVASRTSIVPIPTA